MYHSYIAVGDSFTEGLGDERPDGTLRGWADRVAAGLANQALDATTAEGEKQFRYANLAIRGRKLEPIVLEQLPPAISQQPDLISFNGGGNNMLRPHFEAAASVDESFRAVDRIRESGIHVLVLAGPDPVNNLPLGKMISERGRMYTELAAERAAKTDGITFVDNYHDRAFEDSTYWSPDGLHLSTAGHLRVAANCLDALGVPYPSWWPDPRDPEPDPKDYGSREYLRTHVAPWVGRRLTGRSSGDGRIAKRPLLTPFDPWMDG